jgi:branched-chain amino acid transport system substrate-binding protein
MSSRGIRWAQGLLAASAMLVIAGCGSGPGGATAHGRRELTVGTLFASTGPFAALSQAQLAGLRFWAEQVNASGGLYVRAMHATMPVRIVALDDLSSISRAGQEYLDLVQQRHVNVLVSDYGSLLTSPAVPIAQQNGVYLFDPTATDPEFFTTSIFGNGASDMVMAAAPSDGVLSAELARAIHLLGVRKIVVLYDTSPFAESQSNGLQQALIGYGITPIAMLPVDSSTLSGATGAAGNSGAVTATDYSKQLATLAALHPDAVIEVGYVPDDLAFFQQLAARHDGFRMVFTVNAGLALAQLEASLPRCALAGTYTFLPPPFRAYPHVSAGLTTAQFQQRFLARRGTSGPARDVAGAIPGYTTGLVAQQILARAPGLDPDSMQRAALALSGSLRTLDGTFRIDKQGVQLGELRPVARLEQTAGGIRPAALGSAATPGPGRAAGHTAAACGGSR